MQGNVIIPLTQGKVAVIDAEDADRILRHKWTFGARRYAYRARRKSEQPGSLAIYMHREILGVSESQQVDHKNRNGIDNRRCNLRVATPSQNAANKGLLSTNTSGYRGVSFQEAPKSLKHWHAYISHQGTQRTLGHFKTAEEAARVYDAAAKELRGEFAVLNFPEE